MWIRKAESGMLATAAKRRPRRLGMQPFCGVSVYLNRLISSSDNHLIYYFLLLNNAVWIRANEVILHYKRHTPHYTSKPFRAVTIATGIYSGMSSLGH